MNHSSPPTDLPASSAAAPSEADWSERTIIVTGGGAGIGRAIADDLAGLGASLHIVSRSAGSTQAAAAIRAAGGRARAHLGDIADEDFCRQLVASIEREDGAIDAVVNAAAILGPAGPFSEVLMSRFREVVAINLFGTCNLMRWTLPQMEARGFGRIINFAGGGAAYAYPQFSPYGVSKCAIVRLTETVAAEIESSDVTVNVIAPGAVETTMLAEVRSHGGEVRTVTDILEPVRLVRFLASAASGHINGRFIHVRDRYTDANLYASADMLKLRRVEQR